MQNAFVVDVWVYELFRSVQSYAEIDAKRACVDQVSVVFFLHLKYIFEPGMGGLERDLVIFTVKEEVDRFGAAHHSVGVPIYVNDPAFVHRDVDVILLWKVLAAVELFPFFV